MKAFSKKITAIVAAVATSACLAVSSSAYTEKGQWHVALIPGSPSIENHSPDQVTIYTHGGGYQTYCSSIYGSNDRYVNVSAPGMTSYNITSTGYSSKKTSTASGSMITFTFTAGTSHTIASGSVGFYD